MGLLVPISLTRSGLPPAAEPLSIPPTAAKEHGAFVNSTTEELVRWEGAWTMGQVPGDDQKKEKIPDVCGTKGPAELGRF